MSLLHTIHFVDCGRFAHVQVAADIVNQVMKKLVELCTEGAKVLDICLEGDKLIEEGTGAVYNKAVKGVKVAKGVSTFACVGKNKTHIP